MYLSIFIVLLLLILMILLLSDMCFLIRFAFHTYRKKKDTQSMRYIKRSSYVIGGILVMVFCSILLSQKLASTPSIKGEHSIAVVEEITLNGRNEWISIRGNDTKNPILLFLAGGPGGSQMAAVRHELGELEEHFTIVNWDQPGSAKSYSQKQEDLLLETYIEDGIALSEYLCERFEQPSIYIVGESWGSALGIFLAERRPDLYTAFIGTGQMVDFLETENRDYDKAMEIAEERGDTAKIKKLKENGRPPYYGDDVTWKSAEYLNYLSSYMTQNPDITNSGYQTFRDLFSSEYGILDKVNYLRGILTTFNHVYPQLYGIDLRKGYTQIDIPVYFFLGRHDINAPVDLAEDYYNVLQAPHKELIWFEHSGHSPWINESDRFVQELRNVLRDTQ